MADFGIIIQPTKGRTYEEIIAARDKGAQALTARGIQVRDTLMIETRYTEEQLEKMGVVSREAFFTAEIMRMMSLCKAAALVGDWKKDERCKRLKLAAEWFGVELLEA